MNHDTPAPICEIEMPSLLPHLLLFSRGDRFYVDLGYILDELRIDRKVGEQSLRDSHVFGPWVLDYPIKLMDNLDPTDIDISYHRALAMELMAFGAWIADLRPAAEQDKGRREAMTTYKKVAFRRLVDFVWGRAADSPFRSLPTSDAMARTLEARNTYMWAMPAGDYPWAQDEGRAS